MMTMMHYYYFDCLAFVVLVVPPVVVEKISFVVQKEGWTPQQATTPMKLVIR